MTDPRNPCGPPADMTPQPTPPRPERTMPTQLDQVAADVRLVHDALVQVHTHQALLAAGLAAVLENWYGEKGLRERGQGELLARLHELATLGSTYTPAGLLRGLRGPSMGREPHQPHDLGGPASAAPANLDRDRPDNPGVPRGSVCEGPGGCRG